MNENNDLKAAFQRRAQMGGGMDSGMGGGASPMQQMGGQPGQPSGAQPGTQPGMQPAQEQSTGGQSDGESEAMFILKVLAKRLQDLPPHKPEKSQMSQEQPII